MISPKASIPEPVPASGFLVSAGDYRRIYEFPYQLLHPKYGRIQWQLEPMFVTDQLHTLLLAAYQTDDPQYKNKLFEIPCKSEGIISTLDKKFFAGIWRVFWCPGHKTMVYDSYPPDGTDRLVIDASSFMGTDIYYK